MKPFIVSLRFVLVLTILTGVLYPLSITYLGHLLFPSQVGGSLIINGNGVIGSKLIGQTFSDPKHFWSRPSAVKYDSAGSGATNQSLSSSEFLKAVNERSAQGAVQEMRFTSASGLDPDISPEAAEAQLDRISRARNLTDFQLKQLRTILMQSVNARQIGILGEPRVNVLLLNLAMKQQFGERE